MGSARAEAKGPRCFRAPGLGEPAAEGRPDPFFLADASNLLFAVIVLVNLELMDVVGKNKTTKRKNERRVRRVMEFLKGTDYSKDRRSLGGLKVISQGHPAASDFAVSRLG